MRRIFKCVSLSVTVYCNGKTIKTTQACLQTPKTQNNYSVWFQIRPHILTSVPLTNLYCAHITLQLSKHGQ